MITTSVRRQIEKREENLSPYATRSSQTRGRKVPETPSHLRTEFQRDRDRIVHCKAFRRIKHKTQVFIAPLGDHYVTRLTHTLEVAQISRTIARALNLNEDLTEAIALGHDLGHTPFGHIWEDELDKLQPSGFRHSHQSLRIVDHIEKNGEGLNLTKEVRQGIVSHSKPRGDFLNSALTNGLTLEGQICRISDAVAYLNHDLADAFRAGVLEEKDLPPGVVKTLGTRHSERVNSMVSDIVESSWATTGLLGFDLKDPPQISMSPQKAKSVHVLREFMFRGVYEPEDKGKEGKSARRIVRLLYQYYNNNKSEIPAEYILRSQNQNQAVVDYIAGMTDQYAMRIAENIQPGVAEVFHSRLI